MDEENPKRNINYCGLWWGLWWVPDRCYTIKKNLLYVYVVPYVEYTYEKAGGNISNTNVEPNHLLKK